MKKILISSLLFLLVLQVASAQYRTDRSGYEGDFFSLEGALELFEESRTLRDFERKLNSQDRWVNNLDLDYDGQTDYIRVEHRRQREFHVIVLQAIVGRYDVQDVAVIEIEQIGRRDAVLQIVGDEDLYGQEVFVEPVMGYSDSRRGYNSEYGEYVNVYYWPVVQYLLGPQYTAVYVSPYRYQYYPTWWTAWRPVTWNIYRPRIVVYSRRFRVVSRHRVIRAHRFYRPSRAYCYDVVVRSNRVRVRYGRAPINRPRYNNQNRYNNRRDNYRDRPFTDNRNRQGVADRRSTDRRGTTPNVGRNTGRDNNPRLNPQVRNGEFRQPNNRTVTSDRSPRDTRNLNPAIEKNPRRDNTPRISQPERKADIRRPTERTVTTERRTTENFRRPSSARKESTWDENSRATTKSRTSDFRQPAKRSVTPERRSSSTSRSTPSARKSSDWKGSAQTRPSTRSSEVRKPANRTVTSQRRAPAKTRTTPSVKPKQSRSSSSRVSSKPNTSSSRQVKPTPKRAPSKVRTAPRTSQTRRKTTSSRSSSNRRNHQELK